jgi:SGNH hydrolase-like domain, acetyltransferase AlgX
VYLAQTAVNTLRMSSQAGDISSGDVINVPLSTSKLLSNSRSDRLLYYAEDDSKRFWAEKDIAAAIENLKRIRTRLGALRLIVVVVPDKSTVYRPYMSGSAGKARYLDTASYFAASGIDTVDLFSLFQENVASQVDLYLPNDTHLGARGYRLMASAVAARLQSADGK